MRTITKTILLLLCAGCLCSSCMNTKHDCRGHLKHREPNGVWF